MPSACTDRDCTCVPQINAKINVENYIDCVNYCNRELSYRFEEAVNLEGGVSKNNAFNREFL